MPRKNLASCYDCIHLQRHPENKEGYSWCEVFERPLSYDVARTPNDCPRRTSEIREERIKDEKILQSLFIKCIQFTASIRRPFTLRELFDATDYENKNSLWELCESLVRTGKLEKGEGNISTWRGQVYRVKTYFPNWMEDENIRERTG